MTDPKPRAPQHADGLGDAHDDSNEGTLALGDATSDEYREYERALNEWLQRQATK